MFNLMEITLLEKLGRDNGWDIVHQLEDGILQFGSARHEWNIKLYSGQLTENYHLKVDLRFYDELRQSFSVDVRGQFLLVSGMNLLGQILKRMSELAISLPNTPFVAFEQTWQKEVVDKGIEDSERIIEVKKRVGQNLYRNALVEYWQGCCAVTGLSVLPVLKASHAKPWADCETFAERLSVFNGFLLSANLDALFDKGLITFKHDGVMIVSEEILWKDRELLGIDKPLRLRWVSQEHRIYLEWHHTKVFQGYIE